MGPAASSAALGGGGLEYLAGSAINYWKIAPHRRRALFTSAANCPIFRQGTRAAEEVAGLKIGWPLVDGRKGKPMPCASSWWVASVTLGMVRIVPARYGSSTPCPRVTPPRCIHGGEARQGGGRSLAADNRHQSKCVWSIEGCRAPDACQRAAILTVSARALAICLNSDEGKAPVAMSESGSAATLRTISATACLWMLASVRGHQVKLTLC